jgi:hypothetical protein
MVKKSALILGVGTTIVVVLLAFVLVKRFIPPLMTGGRSIELTGSGSVVVRIAKALDEYKLSYSRFPAGDSRSIPKILKGEDSGGQNPNHIVFLRFQDAHRYNNNGEITDFWGKPVKYVFTNDMVMIYSFGKNQVDDNGRGDDIVAVAESK